MQYDKGKHCVFYHRYHLVWSTKYRFKTLRGAEKLRVRDIIRQVCAENGVDILQGVVSSDHVHIFVSIPPKLAVSDLMRRIKGRSAYKVFREFPILKKRYWGCATFGVGGTFRRQTVPSQKTRYFSTLMGTSNILPASAGSRLVMEITYIELTNVKTSPLNVRKLGDKDGADLMPIIRRKGVQQPLMVRPNCEGFEIAAGQPRFNACTALEAEGESQRTRC